MRLDSREIIIYNRCIAMRDSYYKSLLANVKKIGFFGLGKSNISLLRTLPLRELDITLRSEKNIDPTLLPNGIEISRILTGEHAFSEMDEELLVLSPSVRRDRPELLAARIKGTRFTSDPEMFFEAYNGGKLFAISGSDGKSTTAALTGSLLSENHKASVIGNIGKPMLESLNDSAKMYVAELSSFTLNYAQPRSYRAAVTNITPNHLNWHSSYEEYKEAKLSLLKSSDEAVISADDKELSEYSESNEVFAITSITKSFKELKNSAKCQVYVTSEGGFVKRNGDILFPVSEIRRCENHNIKNLLCAIAMADGYAEPEHILSVARTFSGLPHRCELVLTKKCVDYINSSIDTTPARTARTLESLQKKAVLILGGRGKGLAYEELIPYVSKYCSHIVITGEDSDKMYRALSKASGCTVAADFVTAVRLAAEIAKSGEAVLLSPAATSFDFFSGFEERGEKFKKTVTDMFRKK